MCNTCNTGFNSRSSNGCGCCCVGVSLLNALFGNGCGCGCNSCGSNRGSQRICRDCCGNLRIQQRSFNSCGCGNTWNHSGCGCGCGNTWSNSNCGCGCSGTWNNSGCGCGSNSFSGSFFNNGGSCHSCQRSCGYNTAQTFSASSDGYYARQYGLVNRSGGSCCNLYNLYNSDND